ncbi:hypothetical protein Bca4012_072683 [Brassica carinata]
MSFRRTSIDDTTETSSNARLKKRSTLRYWKRSTPLGRKQLIGTWEILGGSIVIVFVAWAVIYDRDGSYSLNFHTGNIRVSEFGTTMIGVDMGPRELL